MQECVIFHDRGLRDFSFLIKLLKNSSPQWNLPRTPLLSFNYFFLDNERVKYPQAYLPLDCFLNYQIFPINFNMQLSLSSPIQLCQAPKILCPILVLWRSTKLIQVSFKEFWVKENKFAIFIVTLVVEVIAYNSDPSSLIREETSTSLVEYSFLPSTKPESSGRTWNGTNTIPDFTKELPILSLFPTDKSGIDANSESKETPPRFNHYSNSIESLFPPTRTVQKIMK